MRARLRDLSPRSLPGVIGRVVVESGHDRITSSAAGLAFHGFLALVPVVIAAIGLFNLVGLSPSALHHLLHDTSVLLPAQMSNEINTQLVSHSSRGTSLVELIVGSAVALWSAVEAASSLQIALDVAYEVERDRGFVGRRLRALPLLAATVVLGGVASVVLVLGGPIEHLLPAHLALVSPAAHGLANAVRYLGALGLLAILLSTYYSLGTARSPSRFEWASPGALAAAVGWAAAAAVLSVYLDHFGHESRTYGALAGVAVTLLWMYLTAVVILLGAELNRELERIAERTAGPSPATAQRSPTTEPT